MPTDVLVDAICPGNWPDNYICKIGTAMSLEEVTNRFRLECTRHGFEADAGEMQGPFTAFFWIRHNDGTIRIVVHMKADGRASFQRVPNRFDRELAAALDHAWLSATSGKDSPVNRRVTEDPSALQYLNDLYSLVSLWVRYSNSQPPLDWSELRVALEHLAVERSVSIPTGCDPSDPSVWLAVVGQLKNART